MESSPKARMTCSPASDTTAQSPETRFKASAASGAMSSSPAPSTGSPIAHRPRTALEAKEWCVEYATEYALGNTLIADLGKEFASRLAELDANHTDFEDYTIAKATDMQTALILANKDYEHAKYARAVQRWVTDPARSELRLVAEKLMGDELQMGPDGESEDLSLQSKVVAYPIFSSKFR
jgi:hypothetical protein